MKKFYTVPYFILILFLGLSNHVSALTLEGDGSENNPYTVNDVLSIMAPYESTEPIESEGEVWIRGYIAGATKVNFGTISITSWEQSNFTVETNLVLARAANESDPAGLLPVQLPIHTEIRTQLNLVANPQYYGSLLKVKGKLSKYFQVNGMRDTNGSQFSKDPNVELPTGINEDGNDKLNIYSANNSIVVESDAASTIQVYSALGTKVAEVASTGNQTFIPVVNGQLYIVKVNNVVRKISVY